MTGFYIFIEQCVTISQLKIVMKKIFPVFNFFDWNIRENIIDGEKDKELTDKDILMEIINLPGLFRTRIEFYRLPAEENNSRINLFVGLKLSSFFNCKTTIDGYSYCDFDQMPDYSLLLENGKAYLISDCYPELGWPENDETIKSLEIKIIQEIVENAFTIFIPIKELLYDDPAAVITH